MQEENYKKIVNDQLKIAYSTFDKEKLNRIKKNLEKVIENKKHYGDPFENIQELLDCANKRLRELEGGEKNG
jgi:DNA repair ATPase RecN